jgi:hypothetical protein
MAGEVRVPFPVVHLSCKTEVAQLPPIRRGVVRLFVPTIAGNVKVPIVVCGVVWSIFNGVYPRAFCFPLKTPQSVEESNPH